MRCLCKTGSEECIDSKYDHAHVDYFGSCKDVPVRLKIIFPTWVRFILKASLDWSQQCTADEMADFPRRMRDWLFNVMRDMADRHDLSPHFLQMEREAEKDLSRKWANAAIWKFCDLDGHPHDR